MVSYDTTQIALFVSLVLTVAAIGTLLALGILAETLIRTAGTRLARHESQRRHYVRLAFHH